MNSPELLPALFKMISALAVTLGIMIVAVYLFKKVINRRAGGITDGESIKILATKYIGPKNSIMLIEVLGNVLLIGVASGNISLLTEINGSEIPEQIKPAGGNKSETVSFAHHLKRLFPGGGPDG